MQTWKAELCQLKLVNRRVQMKSFLTEFVVYYDDTVGVFLVVYFVLFCFWPHHVACRVLVPRPGIEPRPLAVKAQRPNH